MSMSSPAMVVWLLNILFDTGGQLAFKTAAITEGVGVLRWKAMIRRPWLWLGVLCYMAEFIAWLAFLSFVPLSEGVLLGSINIVIIMLAGRLLFREKLSPLRIGGILLVALGVACVGIS
jgi:undecaprenyl phosphate-alpha-L-ara4N flippase subunit ArnE